MILYYLLKAADVIIIWGINYFISGVLFIFTVIVLTIAVFSFRRNVPLAKAFALLCLFSSFYLFGYGMELISDSLPSFRFWNSFQHVGNKFVPAFWFLVAMLYTGKNTRFYNISAKVFFIISLILVIMRITNPLHQLFYEKFMLVDNGYFYAMKTIKGPIFYLSYINASLANIFSNILYLQLLIREKGGFKRPSMLMLIASILPWFAYSFIILNISPLEIDPVPFVLIISYVLAMLAIFKYRFFDLIPMAHYKVFESLKDAVLVVDHGDRILDFNPSAAAILKGLNKRLIGQKLRILLDLNQDFRNSFITGTDSTINISDNGSSKFYEVKLSALSSQKGSLAGRIITISNITRQMEMIEELRLMATLDDLTGIYNRRFFYDYANQELKRLKRNNQPVAIIMFDIDEFKKINDSFGHQAGDMVIVKLAEVTKKILRASDTFARFGGEEFIILLSEVTPDNAFAIAEKLRKAIEEAEIYYNGNIIRVTASFGISGISTLSGDNIDFLISEADRCLYISKANGRNKSYCSI